MKRYCITDFGAVSDNSILQTDIIQKCFDLCKGEGGIVVIPKGVFLTAGLRMWSDTTLILESGATLLGSDVCEDYPVYDIPEDVHLRTDMEMIPQQYDYKPWPEYRRAIISAYGEKNLKIIGEGSSLIDGNNCADPNGEEGYRGPHGIFFTNCSDIELCGYTIINCGNFMHQLDACSHICMTGVKCIGGSDGIHLHECVDTLIENSIFHTGDDCIAGINIRNLTVRNCEMNTSCDIFRAGGVNILVEKCRMWGPGIYPHRMTVVQNRGTQAVRKKENTLPRECGRHNAECVFILFSSRAFPFSEPYHDIVFRDCRIENIDTLLHYRPDICFLEDGTFIENITFENVEITGLLSTGDIRAPQEMPLDIIIKDSTATFRSEATEKALFEGGRENVTIIE